MSGERGLFGSTPDGDGRGSSVPGVPCAVCCRRRRVGYRPPRARKFSGADISGLFVCVVCIDTVIIGRICADECGHIEYDVARLICICEAPLRRARPLHQMEMNSTDAQETVCLSCGLPVGECIDPRWCEDRIKSMVRRMR